MFHVALSWWHFLESGPSNAIDDPCECEGLVDRKRRGESRTAVQVYAAQEVEARTPSRHELGEARRRHPAHSRPEVKPPRC